MGNEDLREKKKVQGKTTPIMTSEMLKNWIFIINRLNNSLFKHVLIGIDCKPGNVKDLRSSIKHYINNKIFEQGFSWENF